MPSLGGLFANPVTASPWVESANVVTLVSAAVTAVNLNTGTAFGWGNPADVDVSRIAAGVFGPGAGYHFRLTNTSQVQWRSGGGAPDITLGRLETGYLELNDPTGSPGGFVPAVDDRGRLGTSRTPGGAVSRQWASVCATAYQQGAAGSVEDVSITRPTVSSTTWTTTAATSGTATGWTWTPGAHTGQTASVEVRDVTLTAHTVTFATGAIATQRAVVFNAPTYAFGAASVITDAAVLYVSSAPIAGANATITNGYSLFCDAGVVRFDGDQATRFAGLLVGPSSITTGQWVTITQPANTSGSPRVLQLNGGAHTTLTASVEVLMTWFNLAQTVEWATGNLTNQRCVRIDAPTLGAVGASTFTNAATLYVDSAPIAGANMTITSRLSLWCNGATSSVALFGTPSLGGGLGVMFVGNANTAPGTNPTGGGILYSTAGGGTWRGSGGTVTTFGPAGPHCGECGYDAWRVACLNVTWKSWHFECSHCGTEYKGGPKDVLAALSEEQLGERLEKGMGWEEVAAVMKVAA